MTVVSRWDRWNGRSATHKTRWVRIGETNAWLAERSRKLILRAYVEARDRLPEFEPTRDTFIMSERLLLLSCLPRASSPKPITRSAILHTRVSAADSSYSNYIISCVHPAAAVCVCVCVRVRTCSLQNVRGLLRDHELISRVADVQGRAFQFGQKSFDSIRFGKLINLPPVHWYSNDKFFIERFRAAVSVLIGPCCPALLNRIHANVYTVVLLGK